MQSNPTSQSTHSGVLERAAAEGKEWRPPSDVLFKAAAAGKEWRPPAATNPFETATPPTATAPLFRAPAPLPNAMYADDGRWRYPALSQSYQQQPLPLAPPPPPLYYDAPQWVDASSRGRNNSRRGYHQDPAVPSLPHRNGRGHEPHSPKSTSPPSADNAHPTEPAAKSEGYHLPNLLNVTAMFPGGPSEERRMAPLLPTPDGPTPGRCLAIVEFKRNRVRKYETPSDIRCGSHVVVESDRGVDIGLVVRVARLGRDGTVSLAVLSGSDVALEKLIPMEGKLMREATPNELHALYTWIPLLEQLAINACRLRADHHALNIHIVDAEVQFDGKKIIFYFDGPPGVAVDFRDLVKDMYSLFKARIWMENVKGVMGAALPPSATGSEHRSEDDVAGR